MKNSLTERKAVPHPLVWQFDSASLKKKQYLRDLDFISQNTNVDFLNIACVDGVQLENLPQCHDAMKELVLYAHKLGLKVIFRQTNVEGFFNALVNSDPETPVEVDQAQIFVLDEPGKAQGIVNDYEVVADENGCAEIEHKAKWARNKIRALRNRILKVYAFHKQTEGVYESGSLKDVTEKARVINSRTGYCQIEFDGGRELAGYTLFFMIVQYFNYYEFFGDSHWLADKALMDAYADVPFDGICMDERGYLALNTSGISCGMEEPFRGRLYTEYQEKFFTEKLNIDLKRLLLDMRYAPENDEKIRIRAINIYFEQLRKPIVRNEWLVAEYAKKLWGEDIYLACHNTFHNKLDNDEIWHTACAWWNLPRDFGHTDENITFPVRMGIMLAAPQPLMLDMYYSHNQEAYYNHIIEGAPFNCRQFHHAYNDQFWGQNFQDLKFVEKITKLDRKIAKLDSFQQFVPQMDLLIIFGNSAQNNWYPDHEDRNVWDIDGSLNIMPTADKIWKADYRCALVPDYAITDGRIKIEGKQISFNGHVFSHCLFLQPRYAAKEVFDFLNQAGAAGVPIAAVGKNADIDFNGDPAELTIPCYREFNFSILESMGCPRSGIPDGCVYTDGSFVLVSRSGLLENIPQAIDMVIEGVRYTGINTGILAWRDGLQIATPGGSLQRI